MNHDKALKYDALNEEYVKVINEKSTLQAMLKDVQTQFNDLTDKHKGNWAENMNMVYIKKNM